MNPQQQIDQNENLDEDLDMPLLGCSICEKPFIEDDNDLRRAVYQGIPTDTQCECTIVQVEGPDFSKRFYYDNFNSLSWQAHHFASQAGFGLFMPLGNGMDDGTLPSPHSPNNTLAQVLPTLLRDRLHQKPPGTSLRIWSLVPIAYNTPPTSLSVQPGTYAALTLTVIR